MYDVVTLNKFHTCRSHSSQLLHAAPGCDGSNSAETAAEIRRNRVASSQVDPRKSRPTDRLVGRVKLPIEGRFNNRYGMIIGYSLIENQASVARLVIDVADTVTPSQGIRSVDSPRLAYLS